jgi:release factor glutamine methyltransferase
VSLSTDTPWTILRVLSWTAERFGREGFPSARLDAEVLLAHLLCLPRIRLYMEHDRPLAPSELERYRNLVRRRLAREPVAYITGHREFWSLDLLVDRRVLIPRPETELLVEACLSRLGGENSPTVIDVGTGSGAVAIALAHEIPGARVCATDRESGALQVAGENAARVGVTVNFLEGDLLGPVPAEVVPTLVVSNPPYIPAAEIDRLMPEVREWEPRAALDGGADGLELILRLVPQAARRLAPRGVLALEIGGAAQVGPVREVFLRSGFGELEVLKDLAGQDRVVVARR